MECRKVIFINEEFALQYIAKLNKTSHREKKPIRAYLCERCLNWHLTSIQDSKYKQVVYLNRQIDNLKAKVVHLQKEVDRLNILNNNFCDCMRRCNKK